MFGEHYELSRRFRPATKEGDEDRPFRGLFGDDLKGTPAWPELLEKRRTIVLAEAGSGKSSEFDYQCSALRQANKFAFKATVRDVADAGLEASLVPTDRARFAQWRADPDSPCWLFVDSVDEAKDQGHHFDAACRKLADAIAGLEERVHLYISSRYTDWDKTADRISVEKWLSLSEPPPPPTDVADEVRATLQNRDKNPPRVREEIGVLVMEPLSRWQVERFVRASGIETIDALLAAVDHGCLWEFAARPMDLGWMVEFWRDQKRLGSLREMIEASLKARLLDPDPLRRKRDPLDLAKGAHALDRIGAAFLLCGRDSVRVPAAGLDLSPPKRSMPIEEILPDWPDGERLLLLGRPVFDPATLGRARLHHDNDATLRCYLLARWLGRLLAEGCPVAVVRDLLFADTYGYRLVRPEMVEVSAWLAGENDAIADSLIARSPYNLLRYGDPGSLPIPVRVKAFAAALAQVKTIDPQKLWFGEQGLRRFADPGLDDHIAVWWEIAKGDEEARHLLLRLIDFGGQKGGLPVVRQVAHDRSTDEITQLLAGRALLKLGEKADRTAYARYIAEHGSDLSRSIILQTLDALFPEEIDVEVFFALIDKAGVTGEDDIATILPLGSELPAALTRREDLHRFLTEVVVRSGDFSGDTVDDEKPFREAFSQMAASAALRLLDYHPWDVPDVVTDLFLLLHESHRRIGSEASFKALGEAFGASPGRRRTSLWRSIVRLRTHPHVRGDGELNIWFVQHLGWPVLLSLADIDWLLLDILERTERLDRLTALRAAHSLWRQFEGTDADMQRIVDAVADDVELSAQLAAWRSPPPETPEMVERMAGFEAARKRNEDQAEARDQSWVELINTLRDDPSFFDSLSPQTDETVDSRLYYLWQFLSWRTRSRSRYSIDSLDVVEPVFGPEMTRRFGEALIAFAYKRTPVGTVEESAQRRTVTSFDIMALTGMSLAAATVPNWAEQLDPARAAQAARLAVIELNGFPDYLVPLSHTHPDAVRSVLWRAARAQLERLDAVDHGMLDRLEYADGALARLLVPDLVDYLRHHDDLAAVALEKIVSVLIQAQPFPSEELAELAEARATAATDPMVAAYYLLLLFAREGDRAVDRLREKMSTLDGQHQAALCCTLLPRLFGSRFNRTVAPPLPLSAERLEQLLIIAFEGVRPVDDIVRANGKVYSPGLRDEAQDARHMIFDRLLKTPGEATQAAIRRMAEIPDFPIEPKHLRIHAERHAEVNSELVAWLPSDVVVFEKSFDRAPRTTEDLQLIARRRIEAIEHDLLHGKFAQGDTLQGLADENAVQRWVATQLEERRKEAYTVQRETHFADEKEPDITLTSRHGGVDLPVEIKVADGLSVKQLEAALEVQLCGQYLRHETARHGILLLVHQQPRPGGWEIAPGDPLVPFSVVMDHLHSRAQAIRESAATGPQPIVCTIDVSGVVPLKDKRAAARAKRKSSTAKTRTSIKAPSKRRTEPAR
jgi:hypothetical protein